MVPDDEGFLYPYVDKSNCIDCGLCDITCPVINQKEPHKPLNVYAAVNPEENIRKNSSSGGVFSAIAKKVLQQGGVVFGAKFNNCWEVEHGYVEDCESLEKLRSSKYVQSRIKTTYLKVESFLKLGRVVLFSGTPCQVAGLYRYLRKNYVNLITVDIVCHGVPSPKLWREYLSTISSPESIVSISMKDKSLSWRNYNIKIITSNDNSLIERAARNCFMLAFSRNLTLRPSCYLCPSKAGKSGSDIILADYWGIEKIIPHMDDDKGTSLVCVNTEKGYTLIQDLPIKTVLSDYTESVRYNACIERSPAVPSDRGIFWQRYKDYGISAILNIKPARKNILKTVIKRFSKH